MRVLVVIVFVLGFPGVVLAEDSAPFGLRWGVSSAEISALGVRAKPWAGAPEGRDIWQAETMPRGLQRTMFYNLEFDGDGRLFEVTTILGPWRDDHDGRGVRGRYKALKQALSDKYKLADEVDSTGRHMGGKNWAFYLGKRRNELWSRFSGDGVGVDLEAVAIDTFDTALFLTYRHKELWEAHRAAQGRKEAGAL